MADTEVIHEEDLDISLDEFEEIDVPCEAAQFNEKLPPDHAPPAQWIGLKDCGHHRLLCNDCKEGVLRVQAHWPYWYCGVCLQKGMRWLGFERLSKS